MQEVKHISTFDGSILKEASWKGLLELIQMWNLETAPIGLQNQMIKSWLYNNYNDLKNTINMKISFRMYVIFLAIALSFFYVDGINGQQIINTPFRKYATQTYNNSLISTDSAFSQKLLHLEDSIHNFLLYGSISNKIVPVVFHVLQSPGMPYISDSTIIRQLNQLNFDFNNSSLTGFYLDESLTQYEPLAFIPQIYFCLIDSIGRFPVPGNIIRAEVTSPYYQISNNMKSRETDGSDPILPERCLNIWVCNLPDSIAGFSQLPGGPLISDGIVISYKYLIPPLSLLNTSNYNKGKTLTHLVGSYLGVYELWNEKNPCYDDYVYDTPIHNEPNHGFEIFYTHYSTCPGNDIEMIINFMDNAVDSIALMFTKGQVYRMHYILNSTSFRGNLCSESIVCNDSIINANDNISNPGVVKSKEIFKVYPNPANSTIRLDIDIKQQNAVHFYLYDITGKILIHENWTEPVARYSRYIDVSTIHPGIYYIRLNTVNEYKICPITIIN